MSETEITGENSGPQKIPQPHGGALLSGGVPGNRGGSGGGRPPDEFKARMRELATTAEAEAYFGRCMAGEFGPKFYLAALAHATDRGYGKAAQPIVGDAEQPVEIVVRYAK